MKNIKSLCKVIPFEFNNYKIRLISFKDTDWYIDNCMKPYYEEFIDGRFSEHSKGYIEECFYKIIRGYVCKVETVGEARLVLFDKNTNAIVGGVTLFERELNNEDVIELAYFILPEYQGKGISYIMLNNVIDVICKSTMKFSKLTAVIREDNEKSLGLIKKLGFKEVSRAKGKYKMNITFVRERYI